MTIIFEIAGGSSIGRIRGNNEDNYYFLGRVLPLEHTDAPTLGRQLRVSVTEDVDSGFVIAIFDGMGGTENGQTASYLSAKRFKDCIEHPAPGDSITKCLTEAIEKMDDEVRDFARQNRYQCGTTAVILCFLNDRFQICNVGDSRAFLLRDGLLTQLSEDHTDEEILRKFGITDRKPHLTQFIGMDEENVRLVPYLADGALQNGDRFVLCSDGLTDMVSEERISGIVQHAASAEACAGSLIGAALDAGGRDNVTVECVFVSIL